MRFNDARGICWMVLARFVLLAAVLLAASSVSAAVTIDLGPSDYRNWGTGSYQNTPDGIRSSFGQTVRVPPTLNTLNVTRNPVVPYGSLVNGMKNFVRITPGSVAASAAVTAAFMAMDWYFDQDSGEWVKDEEQLIDDPTFGLWRANGAQCNTVTGPSPESVCRSTVNCVYTPAQGVVYERVDILSSTSAACVIRFPQGHTGSSHSMSRIAECPGGSTYNPNTGLCIGNATGVPLTASDWAALEGELVTMPPAIVGGSANDVMERHGQIPGYHDTTITGPSSVTGPETTTTTTTETGDNIVTNTQTTTNISYGDTTITTTDTTTTTTYTNGNHTSTETTTETAGELPVTEPSPGGVAGEWPGFCDWASVVCNFIDWFQEPFDAPEVEWPLIEDQDYEEEFNYTLAASCPEPYTIELALFPPVQFNWQPFCDLATFIKPLVLASAAIFAAFISLGIARART